MLAGYPAPEGSQLFVGTAVDHPAYAFDSFADFLGTAVILSAFEADMLDEVGDTSLRLGLIAGPYA